ncbi:MAG: hypothetical protein HOP25_02765 [Methylotenera sp.]|nr:hypothetical protein [Methylotenera sp.]
MTNASKQTQNYETATSAILALAGASSEISATSPLPLPDVERALAAARQIGSYARTSLTLTILKAPDESGFRETVTKDFEAINWPEISTFAALENVSGGDVFVAPSESENIKNPSKSQYIYFSEVDKNTLAEMIKNHEPISPENIIETGAGKYSFAFDLGVPAPKNVREAALVLVSNKYSLDPEATKQQQIRVAGFANRDPKTQNENGQAPYAQKLDLSSFNEKGEEGGEVGAEATPTSPQEPNLNLFRAAENVIETQKKEAEAQKRKELLEHSQKMRKTAGVGETPESLYPIARKQAGEQGGALNLMDVLAAIVMLAYGFADKQIRGAIGKLSPEAAKASDEERYLDNILREAHAKIDSDAKLNAKTKDKESAPEESDTSMDMK